MIIQELAYKVTIKADEFLNGKKKVADGAKELGDTVTKEWEGIGDTAKTTGEEIVKVGDEIQRSNKETGKSLSDAGFDAKKFGTAAVSSFRGVTAAAAGFLGIGAGLYGVKQLFTSTANEIVRASQQAKFFGSDVNKMFGVQRGFKQAGLNGDAFISASGNARMALANIADPTVFGGLTGAAQNLMVLGARTGLNINKLGDPNKALSEFTRYGKSHSQENLMQVMSAAGFDPTDAAKIKSGELKSLVDSETKKSNITAAQVKKQEDLLVKMGELGSQVERIAQGLAVAFAPAVIEGMQAFGKWIEDNQGNIIGFFRDAGDSIKKLTESVGGATALLLLLAVGLRSNPLVLGAVAAAAAANAVDKDKRDAAGKNKDVGQYLYEKVHEDKSPFLTWDSIKALFGADEVPQHAQSARMAKSSPGGMDDLLHGVMMTESGGDPFAYNASGATGAYQFMPNTARDMGLRVDSQVDERLDPEKSRAAASVYISQLLKRYKGNIDDSLMAYNWGMGNVDQWIDQGRGEGYTNKKGEFVPLPKETKDYPGKVHGYMGDARNYYETQGRLADSKPYQLSSSGGGPQVTSSTHINTVNVNSNPQTVDALTQSIKKQAQRSSTNSSFASAVK
ncbi:transglycosylase-like protein with SLT domain [Buttiauxella sp. JUb87]|uniref:lytic transglycosylase domain-containing protein n=1 Tax=Buttiauxella sp. JUb87 TaxID=2485129 RepID=UPI00105DEE69|nr:lytic transglycosylase domain-containing protein [Buttiauxella sp. JUb87]TDN54904.1 transglycosylase-like protein with SLT domain [Buttiauxella sp. JUb87]